MLGDCLQSFSNSVFVVQKTMEIQDVVVVNALTRSLFEEFGWQGPSIHMHTASDQQVDCAVLGWLHDDHRAHRTGETIFAAIIIKANPHRDVGGGEFHIAAVWAASSNRCHVGLFLVTNSVVPV